MPVKIDWVQEVIARGTINFKLFAYTKFFKRVEE